MLPFLSVILLRLCARSPSSPSYKYNSYITICINIGMQTYLQIVLTVCLSIERKRLKAKLFHLVRVWCELTHIVMALHMCCEQRVYMFLLFSFSCSVDRRRLWKMMSSFSRLSTYWWKRQRINKLQRWWWIWTGRIGRHFGLFFVLRLQFVFRFCETFVQHGHDHDRRDYNVNVQEQRAYLLYTYSIHCISMRAKMTTSTQRINESTTQWKTIPTTIYKLSFQ